MTNRSSSGSIHIAVPVKPPWPKARVAEQLAAIGRVAGCDCPSPAPRRFAVARRAGRIISASVARLMMRGDSSPGAAAAEHRVAVDRQIRGRREQPRMPGDAAQQRRPRIVHLAAQPLAVALLGGRRPLAQHLAGACTSVSFMPSGWKMFAAANSATSYPRDAAHDLAEHQEVDVGVDELRRPAPAAASGRRFAPTPSRRRPRSPSAGCRESARSGASSRCSIVISSLPFWPNSGMYSATGFAQPHLAALDEDHDARGRGDRLGERRHVEHRVDGHRLVVRLDLPLAVGLQQADAARAADGDDAPGQLLRLDVLRRSSSSIFVELLGVQPEFAGGTTGSSALRPRVARTSANASQRPSQSRSPSGMCASHDVRPSSCAVASCDCVAESASNSTASPSTNVAAAPIAAYQGQTRSAPDRRRTTGHSSIVASTTHDSDHQPDENPPSAGRSVDSRRQHAQQIQPQHRPAGERRDAQHAVDDALARRPVR